jgi:hypothetical protein
MLNVLMSATVSSMAAKSSPAPQSYQLRTADCEPFQSR